MVVLLEGSPLHRGTLGLCQSGHRVLGHLPDQGPSPRLLSLTGLTALGRVLVLPNFFHLRMMEATVFLGTFNDADMFWYHSLDPAMSLVLADDKHTDNMMHPPLCLKI